MALSGLLAVWDSRGSLIHFSTHFLNTRRVPGTVLDVEHIAMIKALKIPDLVVFPFYLGRQTVNE